MIRPKHETIDKITVDGVDYLTSELSAQLQQIVFLYEDTVADIKNLEAEIQIKKFALQQMGVVLVKGTQGISPDSEAMSSPVISPTSCPDMA